MPLTKGFPRSVLEKARKVADEAEVYINFREQLKIDVLNQKLESIDDVTDGGLSIRLIKDRKTGFSYTADLDEHSVDQAIEQALNNLKASQADIYFSFPEPRAQTTNIPLVDSGIGRTKLEDKIKLALEIESSAYKSDKSIRKSEKIVYEDILSTTIIINSKGIDISYQKAICGAFADVIAEKDGLMERGSWISYSNKYSMLDPVQIGTEAAKRAAMMLGAGQEKSGRASILLSPWAATTLISAIAPAFSAEYIQKGKSVFCGAQNKQVAGRKLTIIDSGVIERGIASVPYDDEGVPTGETVLIKDGVFLSPLHSYSTSKRSKADPTANSFRPSYRAQPEIQPTNLYIRPGSKAENELIDGISKGFHVVNIMGAHTINPISGDFSVGFSGFFIENGRITKPVRGMIIAGNIHELFNHIEEIGSDIMFFPHNGNIGSPSVLISNLAVSGI